MTKDNFVKNSFLLISSNVTTGILGFIFSIYLSKVLGAEGMGLYNLVMPIYNLFICLMTAGIVASISKITAVYNQKGEHNNIIKTIRVFSLFNISWAFIIGILVFFCAPLIGKYGVNDVRTINAIKVICPAMFCIAISNILKGYFYGTSKITVPAAIDICEKAMRILTVSLLIYLTNAQTLEGMVTLATVALCIGEFQSLVFLYIYYRYSINKMPTSNEKTESGFQLLFDVTIIALPLLINGFLTNILGTLSTLIVPRRLLVAGFRYEDALALIGKYTGMALSVITIPLIIVTTINTLLIPDLSQTLVLGKQYEASIRIRKVLKVAFLLGIATTIICNIIPKSLGEMFFSRSDLGPYIRFASLTSPIFFPAVTMFGILNGLNRQSIILRNSLIEAIIELICLYIFTGIHSINIFGYSITMLIACTVGFILNMYEVNKLIELNLNKANIIIYLMIGFLVFLVINILSRHINIHSLIVNNFIIIGLVFSIFAYLGTFGESEY